MKSAPGNTRAYILLEITDGKSEQVVRQLRRKPGVIVADPLDGRPDVILIIEGADRQELARFIMPILSTIDNVTEDLRLLVTRDEPQVAPREEEYAQREAYRYSG